MHPSKDKYDGTTTIWMDELEYHQWPTGRYGGQHVGVYSGVLVIHKPTGIAVMKDSERSRYKNRNKAVEELRQILDLLSNT